MVKMFNVTFNELNIEKQREVVATTNDEDILWQGVTSKDLKTRIKTLKNPKTTSEMLEKMLEEAGREDDDLIEEILEDERLIQTIELTTKLRKSPNEILREKAAVEIHDEKLLDEMMKYELEKSERRDEIVIFAIFCNKSYVCDKIDIVKAYEELYEDSIKQKFIKLSDDSHVLNEFLRHELRHPRDTKYMVKILNHPKFVPERDTIDYLTETLWVRDIEEICMQLINPDVINMMLVSELNNNKNDDVLKALINNDNSKLTTKERKLIIEKAGWEFREEMAEVSTDLEFLNELLLWELENEMDYDIIFAILDNKELVLTKELQEMLYQNENDGIRSWLAKKMDDENILVKMYLEEEDKEIARIILANKHFPKQAIELTKVSMVKKKKIYSILSEAGVKNKLNVLRELVKVIEE